MKIPESPVPLLLVGPSGAGKTASVIASYGYVEVMLASTLAEEDIAGLPYRKGNYDYRTVPAMFRRLSDADAAGKTTALFLDELDKARRAVADTLLTLIASRRVGDGALPAATRIIAAANPPETGGGDGISEAMISRFAVVDFVPDTRSWSDWAETQFATPTARKIIAAVRCGEIPLLDIAGEGLARRITSPRTLAYALMVVEGSGDPRLIQGLVTAATASQILMLMDGSTDDIAVVAANLRRAAAIRKKIEPLRLP